jgi:hypothetical protein
MNVLLLTLTLAAPMKLRSADCVVSREQPWTATSCYMLATMDWWDHRPLYQESDWKPVKEVRWE